MEQVFRALKRLVDDLNRYRQEWAPQEREIQARLYHHLVAEFDNFTKVGVERRFDGGRNPIDLSIDPHKCAIELKVFTNINHLRYIRKIFEQEEEGRNTDIERFNQATADFKSRMLVLVDECGMLNRMHNGRNYRELIREHIRATCPENTTLIIIEPDERGAFGLHQE